MIRRQLPTYSPLSPRLLLRAALRQGPRQSVHEEFRRRLAERFAAEEVTLAGTGTQALQLTLRAVSACPSWSGAPVALPAYTCFDVATAAVDAGMPVLLYDVDPDSLAPDEESLLATLRAGARCVVAGSLYGFPLNWSWLAQECERWGALLVEDAAQGLGSAWEGREGGTFGDVTVLSFGRGKGWTGGSGGAVLLRSGRTAGLRRLAASLASIPRVRASPGSTSALAKSFLQWALGRPSVYRLPTAVPGLGLGETRYKPPEPIAEMASFSVAAAGLHEALATEAVPGRRRVAAQWVRVLGDQKLVGITPCTPLSGGTCGYLRLPVLFSSPDATRAAARRARHFGVAAGYHMALQDLPALTPRLLPGQMPTPGAHRLVGALVTLPTHALVGPADLERATTVFVRLASEFRQTPPNH